MNERVTSPRARVRFERRFALLAALWALLTLLLGGLLLWLVPLAPVVRVAAALILLISQAVLWASVRRSLIAPLQSLTNVVEAYASGDYSIRSSLDSRDDVLGRLVHEINSLGRTLHEQRLRAVEASALLEKLIGAIDVTVLAFDGERRVRLINPAASRFLGLVPSEAIGKTAGELALDALLVDDVHTQISTRVANRTGRWQVTHGTFREAGLTQHLLIVADVSRALREEERTAWQRLIRVISHEVNNSLAPIKSLAGTLNEMLMESLATGSLREHASSALQVIEGRTESLQRFLAQYSRLSRLGAPRRRWIRLEPLLTRLAALEHARSVRVEVPPDLQAFVDEDQIEQAVINLVKNAIEAQGEAGGCVSIRAGMHLDDLVVTISDQGPGFASFENVFVPFFTTKPEGSGIGLLLSRQIAEAHGGSLRLENRADAQGATATLHIPRAARQ